MPALPPTTDDRLIWDTWLTQFYLPAMTVHDEVGTFVAIADKALSTADLAAELGVDIRALAIHLGLLAALGFVERREGLWRATSASRTWLLPEGEGYYGPMIHGFRESIPGHADLLHTLKSGTHVDSTRGSINEWERGELSPEHAERVTAYMNSHSIASSKGVARQPVFADVQAIMDVGGGSGIFTIELAKAWPHLKGTIMEIKTVADAAQSYIDKAGVGDRVSTASVNMFVEDWPGGHDALFFSNVFHDWSDETCRILARKAFDVLPSGGRIFLHEMLMDDDGCGPLPVAAFSIMMLFGTKGKQFSLPELRAFLEGAGFTDIEAVETGGAYYSLVSARKP